MLSAAKGWVNGKQDGFRRNAQPAMDRARRADCVRTVAARLRHDPIEQSAKSEGGRPS